MERDLRVTKDLLAGVLDNQEQLIKDNKEMRKICNEHQSMMKTNTEIKQNVENLKKENEVLKVKCTNY